MTRVIISILFVVLSFYILVIPAEAGIAEKHFSEGRNYLQQGDEVKALEEFFLVYSVRSANKAADMIKADVPPTKM